MSEWCLGWACLAQLVALQRGCPPVFALVTLLCICLTSPPMHGSLTGWVRSMRGLITRSVCMGHSFFLCALMPTAGAMGCELFTWWTRAHSC